MIQKQEIKMRGIDEETLLAVRKSLAAEKLNTDVIDALISLKIRELNTWLPIDQSIVDEKEYLFITKNKKQRVDRFHPSQYATTNTELRWQEKPGDRYTHFQELPDAP